MSSAKPMKARVPVAVLISGRGSNMMALVEAARERDYPAEIVTVVSNRPDAAGLDWAKAHGIPAAVIDHKAFRTREEFDAELHEMLSDSGAKLIACAGFMRIMGEDLVRRWEGRMMNIHPSLLPSFKGLNPQERALESGVKITGCSIHYVTPELDAGPIIAQGAVRVLPDDTPSSLSARIVRVEHKLYPQALKLVAGGDAPLVQGKVVLRTSGSGEENLISLS